MSPGHNLYLNTIKIKLMSKLMPFVVVNHDIDFLTNFYYYPIFHEAISRYYLKMYNGQSY